MAPARDALYVDAKRTHEVRVSIERQRALEFVVRESAYGERDPLATYEERRAITEPWETKMLQMRLEARLALLGAYYRQAPGGWAPIRPAQAGQPIDLTPLDVGGAPGLLEFHHFTGPDRQAVTLLGVHQETPRGRRAFLARLDYTFPDTDGGRLHVLHAQLPPAV